MKALLKSFAKLVLGEYAVYQVWGTEGPSGRGVTSGLMVRRLVLDDLDAVDTDDAIKAASWYLGDESFSFGCFDDERLVAVACYWYGSRYASRRSWPIEDGGAKLVHIVTAPAYRGRGAGSLLIAQSTSMMLQEGFRPLYARIWHSNKPSLVAFARAGWQPVGWLLQANPLRGKVPWTVRFRTHPK